MRGLGYNIVTILMIAAKSFAISGVFTGLQWLLSLTGICRKPSLGIFLGGALALFIFFVLRGLWVVGKYFYYLKTDEYFKWLHQTKGVDLDTYLRLFKPYHEERERERKQEQQNNQEE